MNVDELEVITNSRKRVFTNTNMAEFEVEFLKYVGFGCAGHEDVTFDFESWSIFCCIDGGNFEIRVSTLIRISFE